jgi:hypothetical protein
LGQAHHASLYIATAAPDYRPWSETPPVRQRQVKAPYQAIIRWESAKPLENLRQSAVLVGSGAEDAGIVQAHPETPDGFLIGFPVSSTRGVQQFNFSARVGFLALKAKFNIGEMLYRGQLTL